jgi:hypothetical protein
LSVRSHALIKPRASFYSKREFLNKKSLKKEQNTFKHG